MKLYCSTNGVVILLILSEYCRA